MNFLKIVDDLKAVKAALAATPRDYLTALDRTGDALKDGVAIARLFAAGLARGTAPDPAHAECLALCDEICATPIPVGAAPGSVWERVFSGIQILLAVLKDIITGA